jgi:hypothetical protein
MEEISKNQDLLCIERVLSWLPISYLSFAYILFIILFSIYIFFDKNVSWLDLSDRYQLLGAFFSSLLIPFEIVTIKMILDGARERFSYLDAIFSKSQTKFKESLGLKILEKKTNYLLFLFFVGLPLFFCKFEGFPFHEINKENIYFLGLDIYSSFLLIISIYLLCMLSWNIINIYLLFNIGSKNLEGRLQTYNLTILRRRIIPVRNYFLMVLILFITSISIFNVSLLTATADEDATTENASQTSLQTYLSIISLGTLLFFGVVLTLRGLRDAQNIIDNAIGQKMDQIDKTIEACSSKMETLLDNNNEEGNSQSENLQKIMELQQKEWEKITQEKTGLNLKESFKEAGAIVVSIIIPIISFMISK